MHAAKEPHARSSITLPFANVKKAPLAIHLLGAEFRCWPKRVSDVSETRDYSRIEITAEKIRLLTLTLTFPLSIFSISFL